VKTPRLFSVASHFNWFPGVFIPNSFGLYDQFSPTRNSQQVRNSLSGNRKICGIVDVPELIGGSTKVPPFGFGERMQTSQGG
jgi:hypothetical protein